MTRESRIRRASRRVHLRVNVHAGRRGELRIEVILSRRNLAQCLKSLDEGLDQPSVTSPPNQPELSLFVEEDDVHYGDYEISDDEDERDAAVNAPSTLVTTTPAPMSQQWFQSLSRLMPSSGLPAYGTSFQIVAEESAYENEDEDEEYDEILEDE